MLVNFGLHAAQLCLILSLFSLISYTYATGCSITLPTDIPKYEPVLLTSLDGVAPYGLFKPTGKISTLPIGAQLLLICPGSGNSILSTRQTSLELFCSTGNVFRNADGKTYQLHQLGCKAIPASTLRITTTPCSDNRGLIYEAGFRLNSNQFATVFTICYDETNENTLYTHNVINGAAIDYSIKESSRRPFRADGMKFSTTATNKLYKNSNQISRFENYFGLSQPYISKTMFFARGHLSPDADFIFSYEQLATYFFANCAPEFQIVNSGNWVRVENLARSLASQYVDDLEIYNGRMGILQLPNPKTGNLVSIYLDKTQYIEAPKYYFKVIKHAATDSAIVMITLNNPFATTADIDEFCTNVCAAAGVANPIFAKLTLGYTFCCELDDFKNHYDGLPDDLTATNLLNE